MIRTVFVGLLIFLCGCSASVAPKQAVAPPKSEIPQGSGQVSGRIDCAGMNACRGIAVLWNADGAVPDPRKYTRIPIAVMPFQDDGHFKLTAAAGDYYLGAFLRRSGGPLMGPPRGGDLIFLTPNPAGEAQRVTLQSGELVDTGSHEKSWVYAGLTDPSSTAVSGRVVDVDGQPLSGLLVFAFADREVSAVPLTVSERTDANGEFFLPLSKPGTVYLRTRQSYRGGRPEPGDYVGVFGGSVPAPLRLAEGVTISGMKIVAIKVPDLMKMRNSPNTTRPQIESR